MNEFNPSGSRLTRNGNPKHPRGLKGKEIGLFYARRNREKRKDDPNYVDEKKRPKKDESRPLGSVLLSNSKKQEISRLMEYCNASMPQTVTISDPQFKRKFLTNIRGSIFDKLNVAKPMTRDPQKDLAFINDLLSKQKSKKYIEMQKVRRKLPVYDLKDDIIKMVAENQVIVVSGETGCGKTTQIAQYILDSYIENGNGSTCRIVCTQPRRISAVSIADRVAVERGETLRDTKSKCKSVGYQIRLEHVLPRERASILFCTTGVLLKQMEDNPTLNGISHLILDEIHERDIMSDFLICLMKSIAAKRSDIKLILMSATLDADKFSRYYGNCPMVTVPGFTHHVEEYYLEDVLERTRFRFDVDPKTKSSRERSYRYRKLNRGGGFDGEYTRMIEPHIRQMMAIRRYPIDVCVQLRNPMSEMLNLDLVHALLVNICERERDQGAILVFLPGYMDISNLNAAMQKSGKFPASKYVIIPLHSLMPTVNQSQIFEPPPAGKRKIILSTNIAETSVTINDVVFVVDCGRIKKNNYSIDGNVQTLDVEWVTLANAKQRKGRAGRVRPGVCFHLYSRARELLLEQHQTPEVLRTRLEAVVLQLKILQLGDAKRFLGSLMDRPDEKHVDVSVSFLKRLNALDEDENLTPLGYHLAKLPVNPQIGKMILLGAIFSCLDPILSIAASLDFKDAFQMPLGKEKLADEKKLELADGLQSDHLLFHKVLYEFERTPTPANFCWEYFLSQQTLKLLTNLKRSFTEYLYDLKFVPDKDPKSPGVNRNSDNLSLVKAIVCAGLYPNVAVSRAKKHRFCMYSLNRERLELHPRSVLSKRKTLESPILVYYQRVKSTSDYVHDVTTVNPLPLIFFGDNFSRCNENGVSGIVIGERLKFKCTESTTGLVSELRSRLNWFLEHKISNPGYVDWDDGSPDVGMLVAIKELITSEDLGDIDLDAYDDLD